MTMTSDTQAMTVPAQWNELFAFLANAENLPRWAVGFARGVQRNDDAWIVETAAGEMPVRIAADPVVGTIDFHMTVATGVTAVAYARVVPNENGAEFVFTQFQTPGMSDEHFSRQRHALREELLLLAALFRAQAACPIDSSHVNSPAAGSAGNA